MASLSASSPGNRGSGCFLLSVTKKYKRLKKYKRAIKGKGFTLMERRYFRHNHRWYAARTKTEKGTACELWAISLNSDEDIFLGIFKGGKMKWVDDYYRWNQELWRNSQRLFTLVKLTWEKYLVDYKQLCKVEWLRMTRRNGPLPDIEMIKKVKRMRKIGSDGKPTLTFRQIAAALKKNLKCVHRWSKYEISTVRDYKVKEVAKLSTGK